MVRNQNLYGVIAYLLSENGWREIRWCVPKFIRQDVEGKERDCEVG